MKQKSSKAPAEPPSVSRARGPAAPLELRVGPSLPSFPLALPALPLPASQRLWFCAADLIVQMTTDWQTGWSRVTAPCSLPAGWKGRRRGAKADSSGICTVFENNLSLNKAKITVL